MPAASRPRRADARRNRAAILAAAEAVFSEHGMSAPTEEIAARAGVAIGTVFRHFPSKEALRSAAKRDLLARLAAEAAALRRSADPAVALFDFFVHVVDQAAAKKTVTGLLGDQGCDPHAGSPATTLRREVEVLLANAKQAGAVREELSGAEVMAVLAATSDAALRSGWGYDLQQRALAIVFNGLRPPPG